MQKKLIPLVTMVFFFFAGCQKDISDESLLAAPAGQVSLSFSHFVRNDQLVFGTNYTTDQGEDYTVNTFKYYIHDIRFVNAAGEPVEVNNDYYLVDHESDASKKLIYTVPAGTYDRLLFTLGVDSARNMSGAQTGALDPLNGMFWSWASGYVMAKLEGNSPASSMSGNAFTYHIGGYKVPYIAYREISLPISPSMTVAKDTGISISLKTDINTWFSRVHPILIANEPATHSPGQLANNIADNYEGMFSVISVK